MKRLDNYIQEKLYIGKGYKVDKVEIENHIDEILHKATSAKYDVSFGNYEGELYVNIKFEEDQDNDDIHNWGLVIFKDILDETKYKKYNQGSDWWCSSSKKIVLRFAYK